MMRSVVLTLIPLIVLAACDKPAEQRQPGVLANNQTERAPVVRPAATRTASAESPVQTSGPIPAALQGRWTGVSDRCDDRAADLELNILPDQMVFHESVGKVETVARDANGQWAVQAAFTGEGQSWTRTITLRQAADGDALTIINDGTAVTRKRC